MKNKFTALALIALVSLSSAWAEAAAWDSPQRVFGGLLSIFEEAQNNIRSEDEDGQETPPDIQFACMIITYDQWFDVLSSTTGTQRNKLWDLPGFREALARSNQNGLSFNTLAALRKGLRKQIDAEIEFRRTAGAWTAAPWSSALETPKLEQFTENLGDCTGADFLNSVLRKLENDNQDDKNSNQNENN